MFNSVEKENIQEITHEDIQNWIANNTEQYIVGLLTKEGLPTKVEPIIPGEREPRIVEFTPAKVGTFKFRCTVWCSPFHDLMRGKLIVTE